MQFLKTLFWVVVAVIAAVFANRNWHSISIELWGGLVADAKLPVLLLVAFLIGLLPGLILHWTTRWRMGRRVATAERHLAEARPPEPVAALEPASGAPLPTTTPPPLVP